MKVVKTRGGGSKSTTTSSGNRTNGTKTSKPSSNASARAPPPPAPLPTTGTSHVSTDGKPDGLPPTLPSMRGEQLDMPSIIASPARRSSFAAPTESSLARRASLPFPIATSARRHGQNDGAQSTSISEVANLASSTISSSSSIKRGSKGPRVVATSGRREHPMSQRQFHRRQSEIDRYRNTATSDMELSAITMSPLCASGTSSGARMALVSSVPRVRSGISTPTAVHGDPNGGGVIAELVKAPLLASQRTQSPSRTGSPVQRRSVSEGRRSSFERYTGSGLGYIGGSRSSSVRRARSPSVGAVGSARSALGSSTPRRHSLSQGSRPVIGSPNARSPLRAGSQSDGGPFSAQLEGVGSRPLSRRGSSSMDASRLSYKAPRSMRCLSVGSLQAPTGASRSTSRTSSARRAKVGSIRQVNCTVAPLIDDVVRGGAEEEEGVVSRATPVMDAAAPRAPSGASSTAVSHMKCVEGATGLVVEEGCLSCDPSVPSTECNGADAPRLPATATDFFVSASPAADAQEAMWGSWTSLLATDMTGHAPITPRLRRRIEADQQREMTVLRTVDEGHRRGASLFSETSDELQRTINRIEEEAELKDALEQDEERAALSVARLSTRSIPPPAPNTLSSAGPKQVAKSTSAVLTPLHKSNSVPPPLGQSLPTPVGIRRASQSVAEEPLSVPENRRTLHKVARTPTQCTTPNYAKGTTATGSTIKRERRRTVQSMSSLRSLERSESQLGSDSGNKKGDSGPLLQPLLSSAEAERTVTIVFDLDETLCNNRCIGPPLLRPGAELLLRTLRGLCPSPAYKPMDTRTRNRRATSRLYDEAVLRMGLGPPYRSRVEQRQMTGASGEARPATEKDANPQRLEIVLWTASEESKARRVVQLIDPHSVLFDEAIYRDIRWYRDAYYTKKLCRLGRDMDRVVIVENSLFSVEMNPQNAIIVSSFVRNHLDRDLFLVREILRDWVRSMRRHRSAVIALQEAEGAERKASEEAPSIVATTLSLATVTNSLTLGNGTVDGGESANPPQLSGSIMSGGSSAVVAAISSPAPSPPMSHLTDRDHSSSRGVSDFRRDASCASSVGPINSAVLASRAACFPAIIKFLGSHPLMMSESNSIRFEKAQSVMRRLESSSERGVVAAATSKGPMDRSGKPSHPTTAPAVATMTISTKGGPAPAPALGSATRRAANSTQSTSAATHPPLAESGSASRCVVKQPPVPSGSSTVPPSHPPSAESSSHAERRPGSSQVTRYPPGNRPVRPQRMSSVPLTRQKSSTESGASLSRRNTEFCVTTPPTASLSVGMSAATSTTTATAPTSTPPRRQGVVQRGPAVAGSRKDAAPGGGEGDTS